MGYTGMVEQNIFERNYHSEVFIISSVAEETSLRYVEVVASEDLVEVDGKGLWGLERGRLS